MIWSGLAAGVGEWGEGSRGVHWMETWILIQGPKLDLTSH